MIPACVKRHSITIAGIASNKIALFQSKPDHMQTHFRSCDLHHDPMTLRYHLYLKILKTHRQTKNKLFISRLSLPIPDALGYRPHLQVCIFYDKFIRAKGVARIFSRVHFFHQKVDDLF